MRCMIVDDDPMAREQLARFAAQAGGLELVASCATPAEALREVAQHAPDLLFLDMEMPGMSGLELLDAIDDRPAVIMITGNAAYAVAAFDADVADYLVKPVSFARFLKAVARVRREAAPRSEASALFVRSEGRIVRLALDEIERVEAEKDYVVLCGPGRKVRVHSTMKQMEERLPPDLFVRVHRSHIVRLDRIVDLEQSSLVVGRAVIPVGESFRAALLARMNAL